MLENAEGQQIYMAGTTKRNVIANSWIGAGAPDALGEKRIGIQIDPSVSRIVIQGNRIGGRDSHGILSRGTEIQILGNLFEGNATSEVGATRTIDLLRIEGGEDVTIADNMFETGGGRCATA